MLYGESYILVPETKFLIYGAATTGAFVYANLKKRGFEILAFLDNRANEIDSYYGLPVWNQEEAKALSQKDEVAIVIAVKNVFEHEHIAQKLWKLGFQKLVFRPERVISGRGMPDDNLLNLTYDKLTAKVVDYIQPGECLECPLIQGKESEEVRDCAIVLDEGEFVTAKIPFFQVFTDRYVDKRIFSDIPCLGLLPHLGLFDVFQGKWNPDSLEYMRFCRESAEKSGGIVTSKAWEEHVYKNRMDVFHHMQWAWDHDWDFFVRNAVEGVYNPNGYFNIKSGKHRISYLLAKGCRYIPLKIRKADYAVWSNKSKAMGILDFLEKNQMDSLPAVLSNPYLYQYPSDSTMLYEKILYSLFTEIFRKSYYLEKCFDFRGKTILFVDTPMALYAELFAQLGFEIFIQERDTRNAALNEIVLSKVPYHLSGTKQNLCHTAYYDIAILQKPFLEQERIADTTFVISEQRRKGKKADVCGLHKNKWLYAYLEPHYGMENEQEDLGYVIWK